MKFTPAAATSTCTSPSAGSGRSWVRTSRTLRSPGSETKTLVAGVMPATLRPASRGASGGGEPGQAVAVESEGPPVVERSGAVRAVELDRGCVPVEDRPLEPGPAALDADRREPGQQRLAD